jgi:hypothetical protein
MSPRLPSSAALASLMLGGGARAPSTNCGIFALLGTEGEAMKAQGTLTSPSLTRRRARDEQVVARHPRADEILGYARTRAAQRQLEGRAR